MILSNLWLRVFINGKPLPSTLSEHLGDYLESGFIKATKEAETDHIELTFTIPTRFREWLDTIADDMPLRVELGYTHNYVAVEGNIKKLSVSFAQNNTITVTLGAVGADFIMASATKLKQSNFVDIHAVLVVQMVADLWGLEAVIEDPNIYWTENNPYVKPTHQSDWEFLQRLAALVGFQCYLTGGVLYFVSQGYVKSDLPAVKLTYGENLLSVSPTVELRTAPKATVASNVNTESDEVEESEALAEDTPNVGSGTKLGSYSVDLDRGEFVPEGGDL